MDISEGWPGGRSSPSQTAPKHLLRAPKAGYPALVPLDTELVQQVGAVKGEVVQYP